MSLYNALDLDEVKHFGSVLSLFDGMSCGQIALNKAGFSYSKYYASEVDKHAIKVTQHNYPNTIQLGDVRQVKGSDLPTIDLLIGGSPCQGFSFSGKRLNFDDPRSKLFFEFVRLLKECKPKYWLLENVVMPKDCEEVITGYMGVAPILINANLVSAQDRKRLYWTNIPNIRQPKDKGVLLQDIVGFSSDIPSKDETIGEIKKFTSRDFRVSISKKGRVRPHRLDCRKSGISEIGTIANPSDKCVTIIATHTPKTYSTNPFKIHELTVEECEKIQCVPVGYTGISSAKQAKKMLGNGWNVDVIAHIFDAIAAINTKQNYICIEKDDHCFGVIKDLIDNHAPNMPVKKPKAKPVPKGQLTLF